MQIGSNINNFGKLVINIWQIHHDSDQAAIGSYKFGCDCKFEPAASHYTCHDRTWTLAEITKRGMPVAYISVLVVHGRIHTHWHHQGVCVSRFPALPHTDNFLQVFIQDSLLHLLPNITRNTVYVYIHGPYNVNSESFHWSSCSEFRIVAIYWLVKIARQKFPIWARQDSCTCYYSQ